MNPLDLEKLVLEIQSVLSHGFEITPLHDQFLESTYSVRTPEDLETMLESGTDDDRELILEMIVSPDDVIQLKLEPLIQAHPCGNEDISGITESLNTRVQNVRLKYPETGRDINTTVSPFIIERFVEKLSLSHKIPENLATEMSLSLSSETTYRTCVRFRQSSFTHSRGKTEFLNCFIREFGHLETEYMRYLDYILPLLSSTPHDADMTAIQDLIIKNLSSSRKLLARIKTVHDMFKTNTMETLMLQGVFIPPVSAEETSDRIAMITNILTRIFGWNETMLNVPSEINLGNHEGNESVTEIIKLLS